MVGYASYERAVGALVVNPCRAANKGCEWNFQNSQPFGDDCGQFPLRHSRQRELE
jgi:hypothetical protein